MYGYHTNYTFDFYDPIAVLFNFELLKSQPDVREPFRQVGLLSRYKAQMS